MERDFYQIDLRAYNSFGVDVKADRMVTFDSAGALHDLLADGTLRRGEWAVLGGGNNILFTQDYRGTLIHPAGCGIEALGRDDERVRIRAQAGLGWDNLVAWSVAEGLWGLENLTAIPGSVGAAPVQNIGAYGVEVKDMIEAVEWMDAESFERVVTPAGACGFGYRDSIFKGALRRRAIVTAVIFTLGRKPRPQLGYGDLEREVAVLGAPSPENIRAAVAAIRARKLPDPKALGNAGSFFKNPLVDAMPAEQLAAQYPGMPSWQCGDGRVKLSAGWLIDRAGWRGFRRGAVGVYEAQALVLVNYGGATGRDILQLSDDIRADVERKFGIRLETEVDIF